MRSAPSPQKKTSPVVWVALVGALVGAYLFSTSDSAPAPTASSTKKPKKTAAKNGSIYTEEDETAKFARLTAATPDVFTPAVKKIVAVTPPNPNVVKGGINTTITGGDPNWYFTGLVEVNGRRQALLENTTTGESSYVSSGESWKAGRVSTVDVSTIVLVGPDGAIVRVPLQAYGEAPGGGSSGAVATAPTDQQPLNVPRGVIGAGAPGSLGVRPLAGVGGQTANGAAMDMAVDTNPTNARAERRARRNRNRQNQQNFGDPNNGN